MSKPAMVAGSDRSKTIDVATYFRDIKFKIVKKKFTNKQLRKLQSITIMLIPVDVNIFKPIQIAAFIDNYKLVHQWAADEVPDAKIFMGEIDSNYSYVVRQDCYKNELALMQGVKMINDIEEAIKTIRGIKRPAFEAKSPESEKSPSV